ncbi:MAG: pyruvate:ferredoxin (flavodoxin) oxidoreductase [Planctomycetota bacterium]|nr:MAG: pyruvate:ferredoxin (flavodoxin) oxidoreductase [Planctomycetota bacterium]
MSEQRYITVDGNEAAAAIAHLTNEVIAIYPITPASPMGELADYCTNRGRKNIFGVVPEVIEMQSEAGAAAVVHGALQTGALATTFTASQGLLLMIPEMFKIAGELTPAVFHIAARTIATHALSIFGDHSDVMSVRSTGWMMLCANSVQQAQDMALIAQAATLESRVPVIHFFDGFRTSHEVNKITPIPEEAVRGMIDVKLVDEHRQRGLNPEHPVLRGSSQNPDVFFQAREAANPFYQAAPAIVQNAMNRFASLTGRSYRNFEYVGSPDARHVIVMMGSGVGAVEEALDHLSAKGEDAGLLVVRLYRPFDAEGFLAALPKSVERIAVLDRTKEPGALGEPLYLDVLAAIAEHDWSAGNGHAACRPDVIGGRYGLSSKEFTPAMALAVYQELRKAAPRRHFTVGIYDDVSQLSLTWDADAIEEPASVTRAVFYGLGSDGTVGANKNSVKIIGEHTDLFAQGYFVYDSKKSGSVTASHLRFSPKPIRSTYLIRKANFVACHQFGLLERLDVLEVAEQGATFLLNSPYSAEEVWDRLPKLTQQQIIEKQLQFYVIDALAIAREAGLGTRINTAMQACFFALAGMLPRDEAIRFIKEATRKTYLRRGESVVERNCLAIDSAVEKMQRVPTPAAVTSEAGMIPALLPSGDEFVDHFTAMVAAGKGDLLPVSAMPLDGTFPTGTARYEKRSIAAEIPVWDSAICTDCGLCAFVCPHTAIRVNAYPETCLDGAPADFASKPFKDKDLAGHRFTVQVAPDDCTGCGVCVDVCPAKSKEVVRHKAINMEPKEPHLARERANFDFFLGLPAVDRTQVKADTVKSSQLLLPLFEFSGACSGCGETPYLKLMSQLFGDRAIIGNATGCSSIYGGNLPTTPWTKNADGRGPAWCNSLFEDVGEFGLGIRLAADHRMQHAQHLLKQVAGRIGDDLVAAILESPQSSESEIAEQRRRVDQLRQRLRGVADLAARDLEDVVDALVRRSVWIVGGDGWAYDIGFGGLDHVLTSGRDVNILVLDTGVYSNTGGQASKATPRAAIAKFAANGKPSRKKDLGMLAVSYGNVYVAQVALAANPVQTLKAFHEAESYRGVSLILAYSQCIAHGIDMSTGMTHQKQVVQSGMWPLYRFDPRIAPEGAHAFRLDSRKPTISFEEFAATEARFAMGMQADPEHAKHLVKLAQKDIDDRWHYYEQMAAIEHQIVANGEAK